MTVSMTFERLQDGSCQGSVNVTGLGLMALARFCDEDKTYAVLADYILEQGACNIRTGSSPLLL